jgi:hypothetical protein
MPAVFEKMGFHFEYPENWSIDPSVDEQGEEQVVVSSPNTAFWHLSKQPLDAEIEPLFDETLAALRSEYRDMEVEPTSLEVEGQQISGFDVRFICLDLTNTCWLRAFKTTDATYLLICQAEDREFVQVQLVFQAMLASLLRNLS